MSMLRADDAELTPPERGPQLGSTEGDDSTGRLIAPEFDDLDHPTVASVGLPSDFDAPRASDVDEGVDEVPGPPPVADPAGSPAPTADDLHQQVTMLLPVVGSAGVVPVGRPTEVMADPAAATRPRRREDGRLAARNAVTSSLAGLALVVMVFLTGAAYLLMAHRAELPF